MFVKTRGCAWRTASTSPRGPPLAPSRQERAEPRWRRLPTSNRKRVARIGSSWQPTELGVGSPTFEWGLAILLDGMLARCDAFGRVAASPRGVVVTPASAP